VGIAFAKAVPFLASSGTSHNYRPFLAGRRRKFILMSLPKFRANSLKKKLESQEYVIGTFLQIGAPALVELLGLAGFDFVILDGEHGPLSPSEKENLIRAGLSTDISVMVRSADCDPSAIAQPLDWGAAGIQAPQVETAEIARQVVRASKYHPQGMRGLQPYVRAASYRAYPTDQYLDKANTETTVVIQVEGATGLANLESILEVEGVDIAFIGPYDLSQSLGMPGQVRHPKVQQAMVDAVRLAKKVGKRIGTFCDDAEVAAEYKRLGVSYLAVSIDSNMFLAGARSISSKL
jgi:4-hydroxy-2-oxoheptanedioate aldolase